MWKKIALAAALSVASANLALAQSVDQDPANRGYPAYADPNPPAYHMGRPQGRAGSVDGAPHTPGFQSSPAALPQRGRPWAGPDQYRVPDQYPSAAPGWGGQQDEIGVDLQDRESSPYAGGTG